MKERHAEEKRNRYKSTKTAQIASQQMKCAEYNRTYQSKDHVKKRHAKNMRNTRHSTKVAHQAADVDGIIEATKKKRAKRDQRYDHSKYLQEHGAELLRGGRAEVNGDCCDNCRRKNFSSDPRYALEFEVVSSNHTRQGEAKKQAHSGDGVLTLSGMCSVPEEA